MMCSIRRGALSALLVALAGFGAASLPCWRAPSVAAAGKQAPAAAGSYAAVAPILKAQCASCHSAQGGAPFNLQTYEDAKQWGGQILDVTQSRYMPPWLPAPDKGELAGARRLSDAELGAIRAWVGAGMPAAPGAAAAEAHTDPEWILGKPDAVLNLAEPVKLAGNGPDVFTNLVVPMAAAEPHSLRAIAIRPSDPQTVRSIWIAFDESGTLQKTEGWQQGIAGMEMPADLTSSRAGLIFWEPGVQAVQPRAGEQWQLSPGGDLVLATHLKTTGRKQAVQFQIGLYYADSSAAKGNALVLPLTHKGVLQLPAGAAATPVEDSYTLPQASAVTAIYPRAHFLARSLDAYATTPAGKQVWLLSIPKWDVDWLEVYSYRKPVLLPKGAVVHWRYVYDNSAGNPHNPSDPPETMHLGTGTKDEADGLLLELQPPAGADAAAWRSALLADAK